VAKHQFSPQMVTAALALGLCNVVACGHRAPVVDARATVSRATTMPGTCARGESTYRLEAWTQRGRFGPGIEGPAVDRWGNVYAMAFGDERSIARITPEGSVSRFLNLPPGSAGVGSIFGANQDYFITDYRGHTIWRVAGVSPDASVSNVAKVWIHDDRMNQPNDLAILRDQTLFVSDPSWEHEHAGSIWRARGQGDFAVVLSGLHTPNGIEVDPDERYLYFGESADKKIWRSAIGPERNLQTPELVLDLAQEVGDVDGMRSDRDGRLFVAVNGGGKILVLDHEAKLERTIATPGFEPSNLAFGGPDGCTLYVTDVANGRVGQMRVTAPGRSFGLFD
jgi:sugar lactone lactonase YvrE